MDEGTSGDESPGLSRRRVLRRAGASLAIGGAGVLALPTAPVSRVPADVDAGRVDPDAEPVAESETPYGVFHYKPVDGEMVPTAPINVVCPLERTNFGQVTATCRRAGLTGPPMEYVRYAWDRDADRYRRQEWTGAETVAGVSGRLHVRCWKLAGTVSLQAHVDTPARPKHGIHSYARGRAALERIFREDGWDVDERRDFRNDKAPDHDGRVSVIRG